MATRTEVTVEAGVVHTSVTSTSQSHDFPNAKNREKNVIGGLHVRACVCVREGSGEVGYAPEPWQEGKPPFVVRRANLDLVVEGSFTKVHRRSVGRCGGEGSKRSPGPVVEKQSCWIRG